MSIITESYYDELQAMLASVDEYAFGVCQFLTDYWDEMGLAITKEQQKKNRWTDVEAEGRAHRWWLASSAAKVGSSENALYKYKRIGDNILARGYRDGNENLTIDHWSYLMSNTEKDDTGLIPPEVIEERLAWLHDETDKHSGQPPSTRDIKAYFQKNGDRPEWEQYWKAIVRNARKMLETNATPTDQYHIGLRILEMEDA